ncbi:MAG: hypothetical protein U0894_07855 [Pirellulales bacterium]
MAAIWLRQPSSPNFSQRPPRLFKRKKPSPQEPAIAAASKEGETAIQGFPRPCRPS